ncbi:hypothetical protein ACFWN7_14905 [Agromyces sp. NPDC058484]|uniref:hypothetical protein n=1 Tax=Agromyces sp. NPDC058484 TaxID=3346524 RepID=UPI003657DBA7
MSETPQDRATSSVRSFSRPGRTARAARDVRESHGGRRLATGVTVAAAILVLAHLAHTVALGPYYPPGPGPWPAWIALALVVGIGVVARLAGRILPDWLYVLLLIGLLAPLSLDVFATAGLLHHGVTPTAAAAAGAVLMPVAAVWGTRISLASATVIAVVLAAEAVLQVVSAGAFTVVGVAVAASAVFPVLLVTLAISGFRRLVGLELDLSLVQSTIGTPRSAVGMRASEELAQLDFDAETLLDDVGSGRIAIPLPPDAAERAGSLAARLRVRLIEGRTDTWLRHAVTESAYLSERVTVDDPTGCAGLLSQGRRDGLLLALWLLVAERSKRSAPPMAVLVRCRERSDDAPDATGFDLSIQVSGVTRRRVDPATWDAIGRVGIHDVVTEAEGFRVDIDCRVDPNVNTGSPSVRTGRQIEGN